MTSRPAIAALLVMAVFSGCSSLQEETISLVAQKPALSRWPFKRTRSAQANEKMHIYDGPGYLPAGPETQLPSARGDLFLHSLSVDLRERIEADLADATPEERQRLLAYLATADRERIPALLDARRKQASAPPASAPPEVVTAAALGQPIFELDADAIPDRTVQQAAAETVVPATPAIPIARPKRNPLIEIQGVEFDDDVSEQLPEVTPATGSTPLAAQTEPMPGPTVPPATTTPPSSAVPNPLTKLKEWTTIRKPDPNATAAPPVQTAHVSTDPLNLQGLGRRLRGAPKTETASLPLEDLPSVAGESPHLHEGLQRLIALMEAETARLKPGTSFSEREEYVRRHAELRMLLLMSRQPTLALQAIPDVDAETQEFWTSLMWSMSNYFDNDSIVDPAERAAAALDRLRAAEQHLQTSARLELRSLAFCDKIDTFGSYRPFDQNVFRAGQEVLLYAEVRNFKTEVTSAGRYRTSLKPTIEIVKSGNDGELVERRHFDATEDQSRSPRSDYFHSYKLDLPPHLTPGTYSLKLTLEDELSGKIGASSIDFLVR